MSEAAPQPASQPAASGTTKSIVENKSFQDILRALVGKPVTIVNSESYESAPVGYQIKSGFYRCKVIGLGNDYLILMTEIDVRKKSDDAEPDKKYIPLSRIKRISLMKTDRLLHL